LSGMLRDHWLVGFRRGWTRATPAGATNGMYYITAGADSAPSTATSDHYS
jgi:hypothetical protein